MFQKIVNRNFTTGFAGEIVRDGPTRANPARIAALSAAIIASLAGRPHVNGIGRVYGNAENGEATGVTNAAFNDLVQVGGADYFGLLIHPKHYVLQGNEAGGSLAPTYFLPDGTEAEFANMAIVVAEIFNPTKAELVLNSGTVISYLTNAALPANDDTGIPVGGVVATNPGTGFKTIPNAKVLSPVKIGASAAGTPMSVLAVLQLTT